MTKRGDDAGNDKDLSERVLRSARKDSKVTEKVTKMDLTKMTKRERDGSHHIGTMK